AGRPGPFGIPAKVSHERSRLHSSRPSGLGPAPTTPPSDPLWIKRTTAALRRLGSYRRALGARKRDDHENASFARGKRRPRDGAGTAEIPAKRAWVFKQDNAP